jgi:hypothetical protein
MTTGEPTASHDDRPRCGARKRQGGGTCTQAAGWGTDHPGVGACKLHGGAMPNHRIAAQREIAARAVVTYGLPREVDPRDALLEEVHRTAGAVDWLRGQVEALDTDAVTWGITEERSSTGKDGDSTTQAAAVNVWVQLYQQERKHLVDVCKAAISAGIEERRVRLAEQQGALLAGVIRGILGDLDLTPAQAARVSEVVPRHLRAMAEAAL